MRAKILQVLEASTGGTRKHVLQVLRGLDPARYEFHLACSFLRDPQGGEAFKAEAARWARVIEIPMLRRPAPLTDLHALRQLTRLMRAERYDLVHTHAAKAGFLGRLAAHRAGVPAIIHAPHTFPFQQVDTRLTGLYRWLERRAARGCHRIVCLTEGQRQLALAARLCEPEKLVVIPNGIELPAEPPEVLRRRTRAELGLADATCAVGTVGRITPQKDTQTFLAVAAELFRTVPGIRIFLVGMTDSPRYLRSLRPRIGPDAWRVATGEAPPTGRVHWSPALPVELLGERPDAATLVAAFDVALFPSRYEGLPYALLEAMACAVPVVASEIPGNVDAAEPATCALLAPAGEIAAFVRETQRLLDDVALRGRLGAAARARVAEHFSGEACVSGVERLYDRMLTR